MHFEDEAILELSRADDDTPVPVNSSEPVAILDPLANLFHPQNTSTRPPINPRPKFPTNAIRQRNSNIHTADPDKEFLQTSLDTCRSSIAQQETELKRLKETLAIRDKIILQLEGQVQHAASTIGGRSTSALDDISVDATKTKGVDSAISLLISKLDSVSELMLRCSPVNNITIHNPSYKSSTVESSISQYSQTEPNDHSSQGCEQNAPQESNLRSREETPHTDPAFTPSSDNEDLRCSQCHNLFTSVRELVKHIDRQHNSSSNTDNLHFDQSCEVCGRKFCSLSNLKEHVETDHGANSVKCNFCLYKCSSNIHLKEHMVALHKEQVDKQVIIDNFSTITETASANHEL